VACGLKEAISLKKQSSGQRKIKQLKGVAVVAGKDSKSVGSV
jgi:hypothetical protein